MWLSDFSSSCSHNPQQWINKKVCVFQVYIHTFSAGRFVAYAFASLCVCLYLPFPSCREKSVCFRRAIRITSLMLEATCWETNPLNRWHFGVLISVEMRGGKRDGLAAESSAVSKTTATKTHHSDESRGHTHTHTEKNLLILGQTCLNDCTDHLWTAEGSPLTLNRQQHGQQPLSSLMKPKLLSTDPSRCRTFTFAHF